MERKRKLLERFFFIPDASA